MTAAAELLCDFVNTRSVEPGTDELDGPEALEAWLEARGLMRAPPVSEACWADAIRLRESLRMLAVAHHDAPSRSHHDAVAAVNRLADAARLRLELGDDGAVRLVPASGEREALAGLFAALAEAAADGSWERVKACPADTCLWAFVDRSKNRSRTWCSMEVCGAREKARAYRARRRAGA